MAAGLGLAALVQAQPAGSGVIAAWAVGLVISGAGIGMAWPHLSAGPWERSSNRGAGGGARGDQQWCS